MVMESEIHVYVLLFQQYGRKSFGFSVILSMLPLQNEKKAISAREAVKILLEIINLAYADNGTTLEVSGSCGGCVCVCVFFRFVFALKEGRK